MHSRHSLSLPCPRLPPHPSLGVNADFLPSGPWTLLSTQLSLQLGERDVTVQRLQQERAFLQQQYDTLRRESMSPTFHQVRPSGAGGGTAAAAAAAAAVRAEEAAAVAAAQQPEDMEVDEPDRKRKRIAVPKQQLPAQPEDATFSFGGAAAVTGTGVGGGAPRGRAAGSAAVTPAAGAMTAPSASPFSSERRVALGQRGAPAPPASGGGAGPVSAGGAVGRAGLEAPSNLVKMTVQVRICN